MYSATLALQSFKDKNTVSTWLRNTCTVHVYVVIMGRWMCCVFYEKKSQCSRTNEQFGQHCWVMFTAYVITMGMWVCCVFLDDHFRRSRTNGQFERHCSVHVQCMS